jgi:gamma-glutamyltranspeptidase
VLQARKKLIEFKGLTPPASMSWMGNPDQRGCTTNIAVADKDHNIVLLTQTLGGIFGSLHVVPGTGITLNNEGIFGFLLDPVDGPNYPAPGKRIENQMGGAEPRGGYTTTGFQLH